MLNNRFCRKQPKGNLLATAILNFAENNQRTFTSIELCCVNTTINEPFITRSLVRSNQRRIKVVFVASPLSTQH
jgi:hypothetical protein